jgi:hypothetical protein
MADKTPTEKAREEQEQEVAEHAGDTIQEPPERPTPTEKANEEKEKEAAKRPVIP